MTFYRGQKVVCVDASRAPSGLVSRFVQWLFGRDWPIQGEVYTICLPYVEVPPLEVGVELVEIKNSWIVKRCFRQSRFRPLVDTKTDISVFTSMLNTTKQKERA